MMDQGAGLVINVIRTQAECLRYHITLNDVYKLWTDMHNLFIYSSTIINVEQRKDLKRTSVHIMPRAIPCTATCDPRYGRGRCGAFAPAGVRARKLWGLI